jgi:hypothetical protein
LEKNTLTDEQKNIYKLLKKENFNNRLGKLIKKFGNKKVLIYGAGDLSKIIFEDYDVKPLNIIGVMDKNFSDSSEKFYGYNTYTVNSINNIDFDVILVFVMGYRSVINDVLSRVNNHKSLQIEPAIATSLEKQIKEDFERITFDKAAKTFLRHYDIHNVIKEYAGFPKWMPNFFMTTDGWSTNYLTMQTELRANKGLMLVINKKHQKCWEESGNKKIAILGLHYIHYRRKMKYKQADDARGTIVCPGHGVALRYMDYDIDDLCKKLKELPPKFHPVTICLGIHDIEIWKKDVEFKKHGFEVVTAGFPWNENFNENLYKILGRHKYCVSNFLSTVTMLAMELGLPFFLLGEKDLKMKILSQPGSLKYCTKVYAYNEIPSVNEQALKLFQTGPIDRITPEQQLFLEEEIGIKDCISPKELNALLWETFINFELKRYVDDFLRTHFYKQNRLDINKTNIELKCPDQSITIEKSMAFFVPVTIHNRGKGKLISSLPYPVYLSYHWLDKNGEFINNGIKTPIRKPIFPGQSAVVDTVIRTWLEKGEYILQITLLQDTCFWFEKSIENFSPINIKVTVS